MIERLYSHFTEYRYDALTRAGTRGSRPKAFAADRSAAAGSSSPRFYSVLMSSRRRCSRGRPIPGVLDHEPADQFATTADGSLDLIEDDRGLLARFVPNDSEAGRKVIRCLQERSIQGCSFAMGGIKDAWHFDAGLVRTIRSIGRLDDVSLLHQLPPAYPATSANLGVSRDWIAADQVRQQRVADQSRLDRLRLATVSRRTEIERQREADRDRLRILTISRRVAA